MLLLYLYFEIFPVIEFTSMLILLMIEQHKNLSEEVKKDKYVNIHVTAFKFLVQSC